MSAVEAVTAPWGQEDGQALKNARTLRGDTQDECAEVIAQHAGDDPVSQGTVYSWEKGRHSPSAENRAAIAKYIEEARAGVPAGARIHARAGTPLHRRRRSMADAGLTNPLTGERELSDRQAELVDMITREAPNLDEAGMEAIRFNARVLGLGEYLDSN